MYPKELTEFCDQLLAQGCEKLEMTMGIISHICYNVYELVAVQTDNPAITAGATLELQDTYCREVVTTGATVAITEVGGERGMQNHPLYLSIPLEAYISTPIYYKDDIWGTLNFSSQTILENDFTQADIDWLENAAKRLAQKLASLEI